MSNTLTTLFGWGRDSGSVELPESFPLSIIQSDFVRTDIRNIYSKILTDVMERTQGLTDKITPLLWDNCLASESTKGLISLLSEAMSDKEDLTLVYNATLGTIRKANMSEATEIKADYEKQGESAKGVYLSFKHYEKTDMIKLYSALEYCVIASLNKSMNLSKAVQFKMSDLRGSVSLSDSANVKGQAVNVAKSLAKGHDVLIDKNDIIEMAKPDVTTAKEGMAFIDSKRSFYLGLPISYINGEQTAGIGSTGEADTKAVERGLKNYYFSILKPAVESIFKIKTSFKSQDFRMLDSGLNALKTFELVDNSLIGPDMKKLIIEKLFDIDADDNDVEEPVEPVQPDVQTALPPPADGSQK